MNQLESALAAFCLIVVLGLGLLATYVIQSRDPSAPHPTSQGPDVPPLPADKEEAGVIPWSLEGDSADVGPRPPDDKETKAAPVEADPWPECAVIRRWFAENLAEPASLEIVQWVERRLESRGEKAIGAKSRGHDSPGNAVVIMVRYQAADRDGAKPVEIRDFSVTEQKVNWTRIVRD